MSLLVIIVSIVGAGAIYILGQTLGRRHAATSFHSLEAELRRQLEDSTTKREALLREMTLKDAERIRAMTEAELLAKQLNEERALLDDVKKELSEHFKSVSAENLQKSNQQFLELAKISFEKLEERSKHDLTQKSESFAKLVEPVRETLKKFDDKISELELKRVGAYEGLIEQVKSLKGTQESLRDQTQTLARALSSPKVGGRWGEIQLKRVVELAGMLSYCDFSEQVSVAGDEDTAAIRPDLVVHLPGGKTIVVDAKAPLTSYLESLESGDEERRIEKLKTHARHIKDHVQQLSKKTYWDKFDHTPEFVVLFLPGEIFYSAALEYSPELIELGVEQGVIIATPTTLISLLKAVSYGWKQESLAENAQKIADVGRELYARVKTFSEHFIEVGRGLRKALESYNKGVGTLESRVLSSARKFETLGISSGEEELPILEEIDIQPREHTVNE